MVLTIGFRVTRIWGTAAVRLRRSNPESPGIRRLRRGRGFRYEDPSGDPIDAATRARIDALAIPPAWTDVWICPHDTGHIQALGTDDAGRRQYLYHDQWRARRDAEKHRRVLVLARRLPGFREQVDEDLCGRGLTERRVIAGTLRMLDLGVFRTGGEEYAERNGSHGVTTLLLDHVQVSGDKIGVDYPAKSGVQQCREFTDGELAKLLRALRKADNGTERLLCYRDGGTWHEVRSAAVNDRFKQLVGDDYTVKDLRTWHATVQAAVCFAKLDRPTSKTALRRAVASVMRDVAEELGNTPAVAKRSYVDPRVLERFEEGETIRLRKGADAERAVVRLLSGR